LEQTAINDGPIDIVISAINQRTTHKYGERGLRYVAIETGHAAQNVLLQAVALELGAVLSALSMTPVKQLLLMPKTKHLYT
jgi:nitroreductase